ncbi:translocation/assembly module TamB domain-containing protein [Thalassotalea agarivorans]|uniref:Autotransporter secretion inner membrane protein TamB n=1 Tax=Thalassotalea agarivorans TaxID=349064 RepID=A0A1H9YEW2_THASX|nr:translocation/assembly module TamB domain-containing protein [Thalassotalea agarivorans]SES67554.1 autotransporter secretion inner membrane protein TamB [Thalassotalea agarivorans]
MIKRILKILLAIFLFLILFILFLVGTSWGAQLTVWAVNKIEFIDIEYQDGALLNKAQFKYIRIDLPSFKLDVESFTLDLKLNCLLRKTVCVEELSAKSINVDLPYIPPPEEIETPVVEEEVTVQNQLFSLPVGADVKLLSVDEFTLTMDGLAVRVDAFKTAAKAKGTLVQILPTTVNNVDVTLLESKAPPAPPSDEWAMANLPEVYIPIELHVASLDVSQTRIMQQQSQFNITDIHTEIAIGKHTFDISELSLTYPEYGNVNLAGDIHLIEHYPLNIELNTELQRFEPYPQLANSNQNLFANGDFSDLKVKLRSHGSLELDSDIHVNLTDETLPFDVSLIANKVPLPANVTAQVQPARMTLDTQGDLSKQLAKLMVEIKGYGYQDAIVNTDIIHDMQSSTVTLNTLHFSDAHTGSDLSTTGQLIYGDILRWQLDLISEKLTMPVMPESLPPLPVTGEVTASLHTEGFFDTSQEIKGKDELGSWQVLLNNTNVSGELNDIPVSLKADISIDSSLRMPASVIEVAAKETRLNLQAQNAGSWDINGTLSSPNINEWYSEATAKVDTNFTISGDNFAPIVSLNTLVTDANYEDYAIKETRLIAEYEFAKNHAFDVQLQSPEIHLDTFIISEFDHHIVGDISKQSLTLNFAGDATADIALDNEFDQSKNSLTTVLNTADFEYGELTLNLDQSAKYQTSINNKTLTISPHCWLTIGTSLCIDETSTVGESGNLSIKLNIDSQPINELVFPPEMKLLTKLSGDIDANWQPNKQPIVAADLDLQPGKITLLSNGETLELMTWHDGSIDVTNDAQQLVANVSLNRSDTDAILDFATRIDYQNQNSLDGHLKINQFSIQPIQELVIELEAIEGFINSNIAISGTTAAPKLDGFLALEQGNIDLLRSPNDIENVEVRADIDHQKAEINGQFFILDNKGTLTSKIEWVDKFHAYAHLTTETLTFAFPPSLTADVATDIEVDFTPELLSINGKVEVFDGLFQLQDLPPGSVAISDDAIIVDAQGNQIEKRSRLNIENNLEVIIRDKFTVRGQGFNGNLGGKLQMTQRKQQPMQIYGVMGIKNGKYQAYGQHLNVDNGRVTFNGPPANPHVDLTATRKITSDDVTVGISITGLANALQINLFSTPSMQQNEILSYLVRGRGLDSGTNNAAAMGAVLATTINRAQGVQEALQEVPLLTDIQVGAEVDGDDAQATISGYLGERTYLKYGIGVIEPVNEITIRFYLLSRLWLETVSGLEDSADIYYSFETGNLFTEETAPEAPSAQQDP